jgi:oligopeptidase A
MRFGANIVSVLIALQSSSNAKVVSAFSSNNSILRSSRGTTAAAAAATHLLRMVSTEAALASASAVLSDNAKSNPFMQQEGLPKFESLEPEFLTPAVEELLEKLERDFAKLEESLVDENADASCIDYDTVLPVIEQMQYPLGYVWGIAGHLNGVKNGDELREAYESNQPKVVESMTRFSQSKPLYDALSSIQKQWETAEEEESVSFLNKQKRRAVENSLLGMKLGGVGLEGSEKERFNEIKQKLAKLSTTFSNNVLDDTKAFHHVVTDPKAMEGVPESARALWANSHLAAAAEESKSESEAPNLKEATKTGPWRITLDFPSYLPAMSHMGDRGIRELLYKAYVEKAAEKSGDKNNVPLIYEILALKQEMAKLLGFSNYAELSLAQKMAPEVKDVTALSDMMAKKAVPAAKKELEEVTDLARTKGGDEYAEDKLAKLEPWDVTFWVSKQARTTTQNLQKNFPCFPW